MEANLTSKITTDGITFDDVLLLPDYSEVIPAETDVATQLTRRIRLNIPVVSAPMDTVTEAALAIALAQEGGLGVIHKNLSVDRQVREVSKVKRSANGVITDPVTLAPDAPASRVRQLMGEQNISGVPITEDGTPRGKVVGIITRRDMMFLANDEKPVREVMTKDRLVTASPETNLEQAEAILNANKVEKLLLVDDRMHLTGLITMRDIAKLEQFPLACRDGRGRLRVGAAVGVQRSSTPGAAGSASGSASGASGSTSGGEDGLERVAALIDADVDVIVVDSAHGHTRNVMETVRAIKRRFDIDVIAGNVATEQGARDLIEAGVDAVKVGIGPGSICTTRVVTGVGVPQITAIFNAVRAVESAADGAVPIIADGGVRHSGDITKALAAGASVVMLGSLFAGLDESPGETIIHAGRRYKTYRGMGSQGAMIAGSADRYSQSVESGDGRGDGGDASGNGNRSSKLVPEGVEGRVPYRGPLSDFVYQLVGGVRAGMGYCGTPTIDALREHGRFVRVSGASLVESHPHDIAITREASNYSVEMRGED